MVEKNIFHQQRFSGPCFLGWFIQQYMIVDYDTDITGENQIGNWSEKSFYRQPANPDKYFCE